MRNLLLSSLIALVLGSCTFGHYGKLRELPSAGPSDPHLQPRKIFGNNFNSFLFKTNITAYGKDFSGLLVTKQMKPQDYRVIFTTELGMKLFDFEFQDTAFTLHYCVPQFNKPKLLKVIQKDIETLLMTDLKGVEFRHYLDKDSAYHICRSQGSKFSNYYFSDRKTERITKIEHAKKRVKKTTFTLSDYQNDLPGKILIRHHDMKLKIELNQLKKTTADTLKSGE